MLTKKKVHVCIPWKCSVHFHPSPFTIFSFQLFEGLVEKTVRNPPKILPTTDKVLKKVICAIFTILKLFLSKWIVQILWQLPKISTGQSETLLVIHASSQVFVPPPPFPTHLSQSCLKPYVESVVLLAAGGVMNDTKLAQPVHWFCHCLLSVLVQLGAVVEAQWKRVRRTAIYNNDVASFLVQFSLVYLGLGMGVYLFILTLHVISCSQVLWTMQTSVWVCPQ